MKKEDKKISVKELKEELKEPNKLVRIILMVIGFFVAIQVVAVAIALLAGVVKLFILLAGFGLAVLIMGYLLWLLSNFYQKNKDKVVLDIEDTEE